MLPASRDHTRVSTAANRIAEITPDGVIKQLMGFEEYLEAPLPLRFLQYQYQGAAE